MPPEGRFTSTTPQHAVFSDDFNDGIITNVACVREALIEVDLISASFSKRKRCVERSGLDPRIRSRLHGYVLVADEPRYALHQVGDGGDLARAAPYAERSAGQVVGLQGEIQMAFSRVRFA